MSVAPEPARLDHRTVFSHDGEMGRLCREMDWSRTPLGPVSGWSYSLRATVHTVLNSRHPMFLFWGPDLVQIYNDGYRPSLGTGGRHPRALGMRGEEFWTDIWDIIGPQIHQVMTTGEATWHENQLVAIERNGRMEEVYWTYSYSPVRDDDGSVGATLVVCQETTAAVLGERRLRTLTALAAVPLHPTCEETASAEARVLAAEPHDVPFALCYLCPEDESPATAALVELVGIERGAWTDDPALARAVASAEAGVIDIGGWEAAAGLGPWPEPPLAAAVLPLRAPGTGRRAGMLVAGLSPRLPWDQSYRVFLESAATEIALRVVERQIEVQRERLMRELERERSRLEYVFQQAPAFLAVLRGPEHTFTLINEAYSQLVGRRDILGRPVRQALPEVAAQGFVDLLDEVLRTGTPFIGREVPIMLARTEGDAEERFLDFSYLPLLEGDGVPAGIIAHGTDVTEQVRARQQVEALLAESERARADAEAARAEAETANRVKAEFLAAMSHELRTPLNAIGGYVGLLEMGIHGPVTDAQQEALRRVGTNQRHLLTLINDILSHARLEAGHIEFDLRTLSAQELLSTVEPLVAPQAQARGIAYTAQRCEPGLCLRADDERTRQILLNLVGNAIKFTDPGGWVILSCDADGERVRIHVRDNGRGIPEDKLKAVFDPFMQVGRRLNKPEDGVGLGLAISRDLARGMGGDLTVASVDGEGSTFTLLLPRE
ncbi:MAG TPA: ATP-binding protein [Longimicrobium sp.]|nr:ATP-binding protein [Longimicrobium sp.]